MARNDARRSVRSASLALAPVIQARRAVAGTALHA